MAWHWSGFDSQAKWGIDSILYDMLKSNASSMFLSDDLSYCEGVGSGLEFIVISVLFTTTLNPAARQDIHESD